MKWLSSIALYFTDQQYREDVKDGWRIKRAKKRAVYLAKIHNRRYYVLRDFWGKPVALNKVQVQNLKRMGYMHSDVNIHHLLREAIYITD